MTRDGLNRASSVLLLTIGWLAVPLALGQDKLSGKVLIDGSSTVSPIASAAAELFRAEQPNVKVTVAISGTGGGFKKFLDSTPSLRTDLQNASRPIRPEEVSTAARVGVDYIELPIALDGMAVVVNPRNSWCEHLTLAELRAIWEPGSRINNWKDVRPGFPDRKLKLYGPGTDSGTFDYFVEAVIGGGAKSTRSDFEASENDNTLVRGVAGDEGALGYFGFSYYETNMKSLKLLAIDNGDGKPVKPDVEKIRSNEYQPLSRPLFLYVNRQSADRPEVSAFVTFLLGNARKIVEHPKVGYVALTPELYEIAVERFTQRMTGTVYPDAASVHRPLTEMFKPSGERKAPTP